MPYSTISALNTAVSDSAVEPQRIDLYNFKNAYNYSVNEFLTVIVGENGTYEDEGWTTAVSYSAVTASSFTAAQTGLSHSFTYNRKRTGWIKISDNGTIKRIKVEQYYDTTDLIQGSQIFGPTSVMKVIEHETVDKFIIYEFVVSDPKQNTVAVTIDGLGRGETSVASPGINIGTFLSTCQATYTVGANDVSGGDEVTLKMEAWGTSNTGNPTYSVSTSVQGTAGNVCTVSTNMSYGDISGTTGYIRVTISINAPL